MYKKSRSSTKIRDAHRATAEKEELVHEEFQPCQEPEPVSRNFKKTTGGGSCSGMKNDRDRLNARKALIRKSGGHSCL